MREKFLQLYDEKIDEVFLYCLKKTGDRELSKVVSQLVFERAWDKCEKGVPLPRILQNIIASAREVMRDCRQEAFDQNPAPFAPALRIT